MIYAYRIIVKQVNQHEWSFSVPTLPRCPGRGNTLTEAIEKAHDTIESHLESLSDANQSLPSEILPDQGEFLIVVNPLLKPQGIKSDSTCWSVGKSRSRSRTFRSGGIE